MDLQEAIRLRILNLCKENNININKLSTLAGVRQSTINSIINGHSKKVQVLTILRICLGLNMQLDEFFNDIQIEIQKDFINYLINDKYNILFLIYLYSQQGYDKNYIQGLLNSLKYNNINFDEDFNNYNNQLYLYSQILEQSFLDFYNNKLVNNLENILVNQKC